MPPASRETHRHQRFESDYHNHPLGRRSNHRPSFHSSTVFDPTSPSIPPQNSTYQGKRYDPNYNPRRAQWDRSDRIRKNAVPGPSTKNTERFKAKLPPRPPQEGGLKRQEANDRKEDWKDSSRAGGPHAQDSVSPSLTTPKDTPAKADITASIIPTSSQTQYSSASSPSALPGNTEIEVLDEAEPPSNRPQRHNLLATELAFTCNSTSELPTSEPTELPSLQSNKDKDKSSELASDCTSLSSEPDIATPVLEGNFQPTSPPAITANDLPESRKEASSCEHTPQPDAIPIQFSFAHSTLGRAFAREMNTLCSESKKQHIRMDDLLWQLEHQGKERHEASLHMMQLAQELQQQRTIVLQKDLESKRSETLAAMAKANQEIAKFREQTAKANEERSQAREEMFKTRIELQQAQWRIKDLEQTIRVLESRCGAPCPSRTESAI